LSFRLQSPIIHAPEISVFGSLREGRLLVATEVTSVQRIVLLVILFNFAEPIGPSFRGLKKTVLKFCTKEKKNTNRA